MASRDHQPDDPADDSADDSTGDSTGDSTRDRSAPPSLADLWLKTKPSQPSKRALPDSQLDLLFFAQTAAKTPAAKLATPGRSVATEAPAPSVERRIWSIRDLVTGIRRQVERQYDDIWVEGEISNCRPAASGHIYFTLKDGDAQLAVVLFRSQAQLLRFRPQDGLAVFARGRISVYESRSQLQFIAETLEPRGAGALQLAFEQLKAGLLAEGLFDAARKRPLPTFPRCIGVITSTGGAVLHDIIKVVCRRHARLHLLVYPAAVQGPGCPASIAAGLRWFNQNPDRVDLILIARGGGSLEDLAGFNNEALARLIAASRLPTVSAIGHETDFTIADFVADLRAPTPSAAAELITAAQHRIEERVQALDARLQRAVRYQLMLARQNFTVLSAAQVLTRLRRDIIGRRRQRLDDLHRRLETAAARGLRAPHTQLAHLGARLERHNPTLRLVVARRRLASAGECLDRLALTTIATRSSRLDRATARLHALSPLAVLNRGYALVYGPDGTLLRDSSAVLPGSEIRARLATGALTAKVTQNDA